MRASPILLILLCCAACAHRRAAYAIRDFPDTLQPWLTRAINTGIVDLSDTSDCYLQHHISDSLLSMLARAEDPILRTIALEEMVQRRSFNHHDVVWTHLDDTAIVGQMFEEYQMEHTTVTDLMIEFSGWKTEQARDSLANEIILYHDNLRSACHALSFMPALPEYYDHVKKMVISDRLFEWQQEYAFLALASYRRKDDIALLKEKMLHREWGLNSVCFQLIMEFPDSAYNEVLDHHFWAFRQQLGRYSPIENATSFIRALASSRSAIGAKLLQRILNLRSDEPSFQLLAEIKDTALRAIWENRCPAFDSIRRQVGVMALRVTYKARLREIEDSMFNIGLYLPFDSSRLSPEPIRW